MAASQSKIRIGMIHPDLGIGGAERLIIDVALGLGQLGHSVEIFTSHHDPSHSFEETNNGMLQLKVIPTFVPRSIYGALHVYLAILRQLHLILSLVFSLYIGFQPWHDVYIVDQLSACVPLLRWVTGRRVVFYCHFPDKLLAGGKEANLSGHAQSSVAKRLYRGPADWVEETTTGSADILLANSMFTTRAFKSAFPGFSKQLRIVYPGINLDAYQVPDEQPSRDDFIALTSSRPIYLSLNRFEGKKNVALAVRAFAQKSRHIASTPSPLLMIGGGYDPRLPDNIKTLSDLVQLCRHTSLSFSILSNGTVLPEAIANPETPALADVIFLLNFTTRQRQLLLQSPMTTCLLYTPGNEHFGIGPVEAMACGLPVLACTSGGPMESLIDFGTTVEGEQGTAWLRDPDPAVWAKAMIEIDRLSMDERRALSERAKKRAREKFSLQEMTNGFEIAIREAFRMGPVLEGPIRASPMRVFIALFAIVAWVEINGLTLTGGPALFMSLFVGALIFL